MDRINEALNRCEWFVLVMTPDSLQSNPVKTEMNTAIGMTWTHEIKDIVPIVGKTIKEKTIPGIWRTYHRYDAVKDGYKNAFRGLLTAIGMPVKDPLSIRELGHDVKGIPEASDEIIQWVKERNAQQQSPIVVDPPLQRQSPPAPKPVEWMPVALPALPGKEGPTRADFGQRGFASRIVNGVHVIIPSMIPIPSGKFLMGSDPAKDKKAYANERPQYEIVIDEPYYIGAYPVTVAEYALFLQANPDYPKPPGNDQWSWASRQKKPEHPVVNISREDTTAYIQWVSKVSGWSFRLPTEAEWEKAAWGTNGQIYTWGDAYQTKYANTNKSNIKTTTPVWQYPEGKSPYGVMDMSGNVWEWTSTIYVRKPPYTYDVNHENNNSINSRVLRGGSWYFDPGSSRAAYRISETFAFSHLGILGFRLVVAGSVG